MRSLRSTSAATVPDWRPRYSRRRCGPAVRDLRDRARRLLARARGIRRCYRGRALGRRRATGEARSPSQDAGPEPVRDRRLELATALAPVVIVALDYASNLAIDLGFLLDAASLPRSRRVAPCRGSVLLARLARLARGRHAVRRALIVGIALNPVAIILICQHGNSDVQVGLLVTPRRCRARQRTGASRDVVIWLVRLPPCRSRSAREDGAARDLRRSSRPGATRVERGTHSRRCAARRTGGARGRGHPRTCTVGGAGPRHRVPVHPRVLRRFGDGDGIWRLQRALHGGHAACRPRLRRICRALAPLVDVSRSPDRTFLLIVGGLIVALLWAAEAFDRFTTIDARGYYVRGFTFAALAAVVWLGYRLWRSPPPTPPALFLLVAVIFSLVIAFGAGLRTAVRRTGSSRSSSRRTSCSTTRGVRSSGSDTSIAGFDVCRRVRIRPVPRRLRNRDRSACPNWIDRLVGLPQRLRDTLGPLPPPSLPRLPRRRRSGRCARLAREATA